MLEQRGLAGVRSNNVVGGETNVGGLNHIRNRRVSAPAVRQAGAAADTGRVPEGSVGAGTGTSAFGWKGGIGSASRVLPAGLGGWTVGVLVQSNFGGVLQVLGAPVGRELGRYAYRNEVEAEREHQAARTQRHAAAQLQFVKTMRGVFCRHQLLGALQANQVDLVFAHMALQRRRQLRAFGVGNGDEIFDASGIQYLPAEALGYQPGADTLARRIDCRRRTGRAAAYDQHVVHGL
jgi:L-aminopeptidase/D-esterase-like protein